MATITPTPTPSGPTLREQAAAHRASKGTREQRIDAIVKRTIEFGKPGTYEGRKTVSVRTKGPRYSGNRADLVLEQMRKGGGDIGAYRRGYVATETSVARVNELRATFSDLKSAKAAVTKEWREAVLKRARRLAGQAR